VTDFVFGATGFAACVVALFFLRFWRQTADRLFLLFSLAFWAFAVNRALITAVGDTSEAAAYLYLFRLVAFGLIIAAIADKNRRRGPRARPAATRR
jgi:hypothetical protein